MSRASSQQGRRPQIVIFDLRRVATLTRAAARLLVEGFRELAAFDVTAVVSGVEHSSAIWQALGEWTDGIASLRDFRLLDDAIEWAEDQVVYRHGGTIISTELTELSEQALLAGSSTEEIAALANSEPCEPISPGQRIIAAEEPASSLYFLRSGVVHVKLPSGVRLATLSAGMVFGEMSLLEAKRSADVLADKSVTVLEVPLADFQRFRDAHPRIGERIMRNLAQLARRSPDRREHQGEFADGGLGSVLMVRRRSCAVSNHESHMLIHRDAAKWPLLRMRAPQTASPTACISTPNVSRNFDVMM